MHHTLQRMGLLAGLFLLSLSSVLAQSEPLSLMVSDPTGAAAPEYFDLKDGVLVYLKGDPKRYKGRIVALTEEHITLRRVFHETQTFPLSEVDIIGRRSTIHSLFRVAGIPFIAGGSVLVGAGTYFFVQRGKDGDPGFFGYPMTAEQSTRFNRAWGTIVIWLGAAPLVGGILPWARKRSQFPVSNWDFEVITRTERKSIWEWVTEK